MIMVFVREIADLRRAGRVCERERARQNEGNPSRAVQTAATHHVDKVLEPHIKLLERVVAFKSHKHLSDTLAHSFQHSRVVRVLQAQLAFEVEKLMIEQGSHLGSLEAGEKDGLPQEFGPVYERG
jgi:hypothetical protein